MKTFLPTCFLFIVFSISARGQCSLPKPANLTVVSVTSCAAELSWSPVSGASHYMVRYKQGSGSWAYINTGSNTSWIISGLLPNKNYAFSVASFCANNDTKGFSSNVTKKTLLCSPPVEAVVSGVTANEAIITWQPVCSASVFSLQYRVFGAPSWSIKKNISATTFQLTGLVSGTTYQFRLAAKCASDFSAWTPIQTFTTLEGTAKKPNILAILLDDGRYDIYQVNGGPSWFTTPAITRIAAEGVNFQITCPATAQCGPSRATFYTGLYPHNHGSLVNGDPWEGSLPLIQEILNQNGYHTGFIGKYGQSLGLPTGFDWWAESEGNGYEDMPFIINGIDTTIPGHITDIYPQLALDFLNKVPAGKPFALFYFHRAPHGPTVPREEEENLFIDETMPFPSNFYEFNHDYPSYYYDSFHDWTFDSLETDSMRRIEFQVMAGVEDNVDTLLDWLESKGILDSTLVMFTSDNGIMKGEHLLGGKEVALEESIRLPMFIRYPKWFASSTVITNEIASNIDIAPTFLELAGIPDTFGMDGVSLRKLVNDEVNRKEFLYEFGGVGDVPAIRAVRSLHYKYIYNYCNSPAEEFYDLGNDPRENNNLINDASYNVLIEWYRNKLTSLQNIYDDIEPASINCYLIDTSFKIQAEVEDNQTAGQVTFIVSPDPASQFFKVNVSGNTGNEQGSVEVVSIFGETILKDQFNVENNSQLLFDCASWPAGTYIVFIKNRTSFASEKITVLH